MRHIGGKFIRAIGQARAKVAMTMLAACSNLKRLTKFLDDGMDALYKRAPSKTAVCLLGQWVRNEARKALKRGDLLKNGQIRKLPPNTAGHRMKNGDF